MCQRKAPLSADGSGGTISSVPRPKHALGVSERERERIRELYLQGVRVVDIVRMTKRSDAVVRRTVRGWKRKRPPPPARNTERDARLVNMHKAGASFLQLAVEFGITPTRAWQVVDLARKRAARGKEVTRASPQVVVSRAKKPKLTRAQRAARDRTIVRLRLEGVSCAALARRFMLSEDGVRRMVKRRLAR